MATIIRNVTESKEAMNETMFRVSVFGTSMYPSLLPNDTAIVAQSKRFHLGSILVFSYKSEGCLIHRLLRISKGHYYCKGDNSFRIEKVKESQLLGRVVFIKRGDHTFTPPDVDQKFVQMSLEIGKRFRWLGERIRTSDLFLEYKRSFLEESKCFETPNSLQE